MTQPTPKGKYTDLIVTVSVLVIAFAIPAYQKYATPHTDVPFNAAAPFNPLLTVAAGLMGAGGMLRLCEISRDPETLYSYKNADPVPYIVFGAGLALLLLLTKIG